MTIASTWTDSCAADPEPPPDDDGDDGPHCRTTGLLPGQVDRVTTVTASKEYL